MALARRKGYPMPVRMGRLLPDRVRTTLVYCDWQIRSTAGPVGFNGFSYELRAGSLFDPDKTSGGHQPRGHDQWATLYKRYYVKSVTIAVKLSVTDDTNDTAGTLSMHQTSELGNNVDAPGVITQYDAIERLTDPDIDGCIKHFSAAGSANTQWVFLTKKFYPRRALDVATFEDMTAAFGANPLKTPSIWVTVRCPQTNLGRSFACETKMYFDAIFMEPVALGAS